MKTDKVISILTFLLLVFASIQFGCSSSNTGSVSKSEPSYGYTTILEMLRKESQLTISGSTSDPVIRVRGGGRSISGSSEPLFVVDGAAVGKGYNSVSSIDVNIVKSIKVLSPARASIYGARGGMGVVEITTK
jgi:outer membrane receptor protein involved in Fe transport